MNQQFSNGQNYAPAYPLSHQSSAPSSRPPSNGLPQSTLSATHTLPPLGSTNHASSYGNNSFGSRAQPLQPSLLTAGSDSVGLQAPFPVYAPTAHTYHYGQNTSFSQSPQSQASTSKQRPPPISAQSAYTSIPTQGRLPELAPMPPHGNAQQPMTTGSNANLLQNQDDAQPTHVVGSQGRRGILPSAAGRPAAVAGANTSGQRAAPTPVKDAEGKFPCIHCPKTYLHAKHLKRHLLRHTGVRPYTCGLCKDTFSRSDILKRHFQKCSVRRGNPTGESHLTHSRATKKSRAQEEAARVERTPSTVADQAQQVMPFTPTSLDGSFDINALTLGQSSYGGDSNQASRSNSIKKSKKSGSTSNRASFGMTSTSGYDSSSYPYSGHVTPDSITTSGAATPYTFQHESRANQLSPDGTFNHSANSLDLNFNGVSRPPTSSTYNHGTLPHIVGQTPSRGPDVDWSSIPPYASHDEYGNAQYHSGTNTPLHQIKTDTDFSTLADYSYLQGKA